MEYIPASSAEVDSVSFGTESLSVLQAARRAGVTQSAIIRWIRNGYLPAVSSSQGWQIPADKLDEAHAAADESRGTGPVPRQTRPRLVPAPEDLRQSLAVQAYEQPARLDVLGEALVSPLVELIRDQGDVVHDQAEVIGWLQAERSLLTSQLAELKQQGQAQVPKPSSAQEAEAETLDDGHVDEVVSWLWNDTDRPFDTFGQEAQPAGALDANEPAKPSERLVFQTRAVEHASLAPEPSPATSQDLADVHHDFMWANTEAMDDSATAAPSPVTFRTSPAPLLQPIVPRPDGNEGADTETHIEAGADAELRQMIDMTEAKIFNLWRAEADKEFHHSDYRLDNDGETSGTAFWQRVWPLKRRSS